MCKPAREDPANISGQMNAYGLVAKEADARWEIFLKVITNETAIDILHLLQPNRGGIEILRILKRKY